MVIFLAPGSFQRDLQSIGVRSAVVEPGRLRHVHKGMAAVARIRDILRQERPDLVIDWIARAHLYGAPAAVLAGMRSRLVLWQHGLPAREAGWLRADRSLPEDPRLERAVTLLPSIAVGTPSRAAADGQQGLWPHRRAFAVLPGIEEPEPAPPAAVAVLRSSLGIPPERPVVGIVGRLQRWKAQHRLIEALALLRATGRELHGLIVGGDAHGLEPEYGSFLRRLVRQRRLADAVSFTGHVPSTAGYFQLMDVSVCASAKEPFGLVLLESMAVEVPVVAVDSGGPSEIVEHGRSGLLTPTNDPEQLAPAIARLIDDPALRRRLAVEGRERFRSRFTAERMTDEMQQRFVELARGLRT